MTDIVHSTWKEYIDHAGIAPIASLEQACWSPWLAAPPESLAGRAEIFPEGQLCVESKLGLLATLSVNKIQWDGNTGSLPTWDEVAGDPTTYENTFAPTGNTLCLMSMNVSEQGRGKQLPSVIIKRLLEYAAATDIDHVIGSFRPSAYNIAVLHGQQAPTFVEYCAKTNAQGEPADPWLRSLTKNGMQPLAVDHKAMYIFLSAQEFEDIKQPSWEQITVEGIDVWWCDQTGFFYPQADGSYVYIESNLWGSLYEK